MTLFILGRKEEEEPEVKKYFPLNFPVEAIYSPLLTISIQQQQQYNLCSFSYSHITVIVTVQIMYVTCFKATHPLQMLSKKEFKHIRFLFLILFFIEFIYPLTHNFCHMTCTPSCHSAV